jgi:citrate synthase
MSSPSENVRSRNEQFTKRLATKITAEVANDSNPYLVKQVRYHGYDQLELMDKCEVSDAIYLLFRGELPNDYERELFRRLCIALINPGMRHPATQASITAGVGKTMPVNVLPIALSIYGGEFDGAADVENSMRLFRRLSRKPPKETLRAIENNEIECMYGFGTLYGDIDSYADTLFQNILEHAGNSKLMCWVNELNGLLKTLGIGLLKTGLCAAVLAELGFQPRQGCGLMQLLAAPGLLAHGVEYANKPLTSMLFESDDCYEIEYESGTDHRDYQFENGLEKLG